MQRRLERLPERERLIVERRFGLQGEPQSLETVGRELGLTRERVRQLQVQALKQLETELADLAPMQTAAASRGARAQGGANTGVRPPGRRRTGLVITREVLVDGRLRIGGLMGANGRRRVVITGLGAVTPLASGVTTSWERLIGSRSAAGAISAFDEWLPVSFACEAKEFDPTRWIEYRQARRMDRCAQLVVAAARQAEFDSGIVIAKESDRVGASVASAMAT